MGLDWEPLQPQNPGALAKRPPKGAHLVQGSSQLAEQPKSQWWTTMSPTLSGKKRTEKKENRVSHVSVVCMSPRTSRSPNMMPAAEGMTHMIPNHVLRVGQTIRLDPTPETAGRHDDCGDRELDLSLENLNRIILELDPTFEPLRLDESGPSAIPAAGRARPRRPLSGHFPLPLTLFGLSSLLHKTKLHKQSQPRLCRGMT